MWQELIVGITVVTAVLFLIRKYWPGKSMNGNGCHGCKGCGGDKSCGQ